jgi:hypothetical protein
VLRLLKALGVSVIPFVTLAVISVSLPAHLLKSTPVDFGVVLAVVVGCAVRAAGAGAGGAVN